MDGGIYDGFGLCLLDFLFRNFDGYFFFDHIIFFFDEQEDAIFTGRDWAGGNLTGFGTYAGYGLSGQEFQRCYVFCKGLP